MIVRARPTESHLQAHSARASVAVQHTGLPVRESRFCGCLVAFSWRRCSAVESGWFVTLQTGRNAGRALASSRTFYIFSPFICHSSIVAGDNCFRLLGSRQSPATGRRWSPGSTACTDTLACALRVAQMWPKRAQQIGPTQAAELGREQF